MRELLGPRPHRGQVALWLNEVSGNLAAQGLICPKLKFRAESWSHFDKWLGRPLANMPRWADLSLVVEAVAY